MQSQKYKQGYKRLHLAAVFLMAQNLEQFLTLQGTDPHLNRYAYAPKLQCFAEFNKD